MDAPCTAAADARSRDAAGGAYLARGHQEVIKSSSGVYEKVFKRSSEVISGTERTAREPPSKSGPCGGGGAHPNAFESRKHLMREAIISGNQ